MIGTSAALTKFKTTGSMRHCFIPLGKQNIASLQLEKNNEHNETKTDVFFAKKKNQLSKFKEKIYTLIAL